MTVVMKNPVQTQLGAAVLLNGEVAALLFRCPSPCKQGRKRPVLMLSHYHKTVCFLRQFEMVRNPGDTARPALITGFIGKAISQQRSIPSLQLVIL